MTEDLEAQATRIAKTLAEQADRRSEQLSYRGDQQIRDVQADAIAELAEIVRVLVAHVSPI